MAQAEEASHAVREDIASLDAASDDQVGYGETVMVQVKATIDANLLKRFTHRPASNMGNGPVFAYEANYLVDNKAGIILDATGTRANRAVEIAVPQTMMVVLRSLRPAASRVRR